DDDLAGPAVPVSLDISGLANGRVLVHHYRVDKNHSNSLTAWEKMESPQYPTASQYSALEEAGQLEMLEAPYWLDIENGKSVIRIDLPRQGVSLLKFTY
ncbi:MAG: beta-xylosidase, partial [Bacteroidetes bacterium]|nr:beta-xylosidase [Bacteroidota bacterium]